MRLTLIAILLVLLLGIFACEEDNDFDFASDRYGSAEASELVLVKAGEFTMGSDYSPGIDLLDGVIDEPFYDEHPEHVVQVRAFFIEKTEVSNAQYRACVDASACDDPYTRNVPGIDDYYTKAEYDDYPVVNVTWQMAADYCAWRGRRLPTEAEWEKAARGSADDRIYPWGWQEPTCEMANISIPREQTDALGESVLVETCYYRTTPVGAYRYSESPWGLRNMTGNVAEWVADVYADDYYNAALWPDNDVNPQGPAEGDERAVRGGGYTSTALLARTSYRDHKPVDHYDATIGFRCVEDAN